MRLCAVGIFSPSGRCLPTPGSERSALSLPRFQMGKSFFWPTQPLRLRSSGRIEVSFKSKWLRRRSPPPLPNGGSRDQPGAIGVHKNIERVVFRRLIGSQPMLPKVALPLFGEVDRASQRRLPAADALACGKFSTKRIKHVHVVGHYGCGKNGAVLFVMPTAKRVQHGDGMSRITQPWDSTVSDERRKIACTGYRDATFVEFVGPTSGA